MPDEINLSSALAYHPIEYLPPKQSLISFGAPFHETLPYEETKVVLDLGVHRGIADHPADPTVLDTELPVNSAANVPTNLTASDLQYVRFKKPAFKLPHDDHFTSSVSLPPLEMALLASIPPITKGDFVKPAIKVKRIRLQGDISSDEVKELQKSVVEMETRKKRKVDDDMEEDHKRRKSSPIDSSTVTVSLNPFELVDSAQGKVEDFLEQLPDQDIFSSSSIRDSVARLWKNDALGGLEVDQLLALEDRCQSTLTSSDWKDADSKLMDSATILLMIMTADINDKRLYKETYLSSIFDLLHGIQEKLLPTLFASSLPANRLHELSHLIDMVSNLLSSITVSDSLITRFEYFAFAFIFNAGDVTTVNLEKLRISASNLLLTISKRYPEQSQFIVFELFANFDNVSHLKARSRQFRLSGGLSVQLVTILLVRLVQSTDCFDYQFDETYWRMVGSGSSSRNSQKKVLEEMNDRFYEYLGKRFKHSVEIANQIASAMATKIALTLNPNGRKVLENIVADILTMLDYPEYCGCETILRSIMTVLLHICSADDEYQSSLQSFAFEIAGIIGSKLLDLRNEGTEVHPDFQSMNKWYLQTLLYLKENSAAEDNSFAYLYMKYMEELAELPSTEEPLMRKVKAVQRSLIQFFNDNFTALHEDSELGSTYRQILLSSNLLDQYEPFLMLVTRNLGNTKAKLRSVAIKNLSLLVSKDPSLMTTPAVKNILALRLGESYASVCDSILELLSQFLHSHPEMIPEFYSMVSSKIGDRSITVRKKAITLCTYMYRSRQEVKIRSNISERLLKRLDDEEDSIVFQACESLLDSWFVSIADIYVASQEDTNISIKDEVMATVGVIVQVFNDGDRNWKYFERFLKEKVLRRNDLNQGIEESLHRALSLMVEYILEYATEDAIMQDYEQIKRKVGDLMGFLAIIVKCNSSFIYQDQLLALQPYLTDDMSTGNSLCFHSLQIFRLSLPSMTNLNARFIKECTESLITRLTRFNARELNEAMPCLWSLSKRARTTEVVARACVTTLKLMRPYVGKKTKVDAKLHRLLFLVGSFGRHCNFEKHASLFSSLGVKDGESITSLLVRHLLVFYDEARRPSVRNLIEVCISHPKLFLSDRMLSIMDETFKGTDQILQGFVADGISFFLEEEERRTLERNSISRTDLDVAAFHGESSQYLNDSICASLVQRYLKPVLNGCLAEDQEYALKCLNYVRLVVRLGFANPKMCFPTVVALEGSNNPYMRHIAIEIHRELYDRYESLVEGAYPKSLRLVVKYKRKIMNFDEMMRDRTFIENFVKIVRVKKVVKFLKTLTGTFKIVNVDGLLDSSLEKCMFAKDYVTFMCLNLVEMTFKTQEEVLTVVCAANRLISSQVPDLLQEMEDCKVTKKMAIIARALLVVCRLGETLLSSYSLPDNALMKFQESSSGREFRGSVKKTSTADIPMEDLENTTKGLGELLAKYV
ncbi:DEKNAAC102911 [Brettanomyces naardenensis]|uniref:Sister chromatid cohesion protein n=1 Tax=Brettanomyces naardenensis TaxID=13370 RepID=A0A448YLT1_BRENA|nr:DEKNAAC102911 [Brettanomyces naardenensis]